MCDPHVEFIVRKQKQSTDLTRILYIHISVNYENIRKQSLSNQNSTLYKRTFLPQTNIQHMIWLVYENKGSAHRLPLCANVIAKTQVDVGYDCLIFVLVMSSSNGKNKL